jgi:serine/threonine protein kinase
LAGSTEPLEIELDEDSVLTRLPDADREWLVDAGSHLLVPMCGAEAELMGIISIGEKKSELPFDVEDRLLLSAVAASAALNVEKRLLNRENAPVDADETTGRGAPPAGAPALECTRCGIVCPPGNEVCAACSGALEPAAVPHVLAHKFRFERRLGAGAMGVVYAAIDLSLQREVAIKTLPRISPESALRLRREAHAAARVLHPHLAVVYGIETWYSRPMLVFELLDGGTLSDRLTRAPLSIQAVVELGIGCADALHHAHGVGVLHGDIKPSNIGFTRSDVAKLLDFGVARMLAEAGGNAGGLTDSATTRTAWVGPATGSSLMGTLAYLSPEIVRGERPGPELDLWSLAIVLYESLTGRNPVAGTTPLDTMLSIREAEIVDPRSSRPDCPPELASFVMKALSRDRRRRPSTALEFRDQLMASGCTPAQLYSATA